MTNSQLWFRGVRPSKFRHVYGLPSRKESSYTDINIVRSVNDGNFCAVNPQFLAIVADTTFVVIPINQTGRIDFQCCKVIGHSGQILDLKWNPFNDNIIASASDDCTIKIWSIPDGGLTSNLSESLMELNGHKRKVMLIEWHPTANDVLISAGFDNLVIFWDIAKPDTIIKVLSCHSDMIYSLAINRDGSLIATTCKDKKLRIIEPRSEIVISEGVCHMGTKCSKVIFLDNGKVLTTGFSKHSDRQYALWDQHDLKKPLVQEVIDSSSGIITPYYDYDTRMLYLAGKGDGNIRYYEIVDEPPYIYFLNQFLSGQPQKALGLMPKRGLNTQICEIFRFYKLQAAGCICETISMIVPRKSTLFQNDIYPDTLSNVPAITAKEWMSGRNVQPILMSLQTGESLNPKEILLNQMNSKESLLYNGTKDSDTNIDEKKDNENLYKRKDNNSRKFEFLSTQTIPDYRPQQITDKNQKTTTNTSTKFSQLKAIFGQQTNNKEIINLQNTLTNGTTKTESLENLTILSTEIELQKAFLKQVDEIKNLKNKLSDSEERVRELEHEVKRLQMLIK